MAWCFSTRTSVAKVLTTHPGGGTRPENWWGCAAGRWKLDPKRSRKKLNLGPKRSIFVKIGSFCTPKDSFAVGGWEKVPQKDRARSCQSEKRGSKPRHICITHHIGSTPPRATHPYVSRCLRVKPCQGLTSWDRNASTGFKVNNSTALGMERPFLYWNRPLFHNLPDVNPWGPWKWPSDTMTT